MPNSNEELLGAPGAGVNATVQSLNELKAVRKNSKSSMSRILTFIDSTANPSLAEVECRLGVLESYYKLCLDVQLKIERLDCDNAGRAELDEIYISAKSKLMAELQRQRNDLSNDSMHQTITSENHVSNSRLLPSIQLPKFSGKYVDYKSFIGSFRNLVDKHAGLCKTEKFSLLIQSLSGQARESISMFPINDNNYKKALDRLNDLYDNDCLIFLDHVTSLFEIPKINKASQSSLRYLVDSITAIYSAMKTISTHEAICDALIINLVMSKVDSDTKAKWEESLDYKNLPKWSDCSGFLDRRCQRLEASKGSVQRQDLNQRVTQSKGINHNLNTHTQTNTSNKIQCYCCHEVGHAIFQCSQFLGFTPKQRYDKIRQLNLCSNCFAKGHFRNKCSSIHSCKTCGKRHNTMLHDSEVQYVDNPEPSTSNWSNTHQTHSNESHVILATAVIFVKDHFGNYIKVRALLDSCSQVNFMKESLARVLFLKVYKTNIQISGINGTHTNVNSCVQTTIKSRLNNYEATLEFLLTSKVTNYQQFYINEAKLKIPTNLELADTSFNKPENIDILIGGELFFELLSIGQIKLGKGLPILQKSIFGWLVVGKCHERLNQSNYSTHCTTAELSIDEVVQRFWQIEDVSASTERRTPEQCAAEEAYNRTVTVQSDGRLIVKLPFKSSPLQLGQSYNNAVRRLKFLEHKLSKLPEVYDQYRLFMQEYQSLGHMQKVPAPDISKPHYFMPHHCVIKPESTSTKLRVVFDASSKTTSGVSLNDLLMVGPTIQNELIITLLRFRTHRFALTADITKMYRQVLVHDDDQLFQLILWREHPGKPIDIYALKTVTYGTAAAPYLAIRSLQHAAELHNTLYPKGASVVLNDFYVDDMLSGASTVEELYNIKSEVSSLLSLSGFSLTKWHSNGVIFNDSYSDTLLNFLDNHTISTLGLHWNSCQDDFYFLYKPKKRFDKYCKRAILSQSSTLFDPLGMLSPIIIKAKIILQDIWRLKLDWDESIPQSIATEWNDFLQDLENLREMRFPRFVLTVLSEIRHIQIHGFCDASTKAFGGVLYVRCESKTGVITTNLLISKSRVAPLKVQTLPRLELCAALLITRLWAKIASQLPFQIDSVYFWSDSQVVLHWISSHSSSYGTFIANRISEIQTLAPTVIWRYIPTSDNPADMISRGSTLQNLKESKWIFGPEFLHQSEELWPIHNNPYLHLDEKITERRKHALLCDTEQNPLIQIIYKHSNYVKLIRIFAYVNRFISIKCKHKVFSKFISAKEFSTATKIITSIIQGKYFTNEILILKKGYFIKGRLASLTPFLCIEDGIELIRIGGRISNCDLSYETKHPLLLPKIDPFVTCLVTYLHRNNYHAGPSALIGLIRQQFWVLNARHIARKIVNNCVHCIRYKPKLLHQVMGNLPKHRVIPSRPFQYCGVDFCGPIMTYLNLRGKTPYKTYIAVFVCFTTKAVHMEAVSDLSSHKFIQALKRLIGRRGYPSKIYCDNATNFVGAKKILKEFHDQFFSQQHLSTVTAFCTQHCIDFEFIPPRAPHFGGIWESAVKVAKTHLHKSLSSVRLTYEELSTALVEIEAIMNSRPLSPTSHDSDDLSALTPGHFLIGCSIKAIPEPQSSVSDMNHLQRWQRINAIKHNFWQRWQREYLQDLQSRTKWKAPQANVEVGSLVLIHEDNTPSLYWPLGRITKVFKGADGFVRVAEIKTLNGIKTRPIAKLALLPIVEGVPSKGPGCSRT